MLAVISDLHFEEEESAVVKGGKGDLGYRRNLSAAALQRVLLQLDALAQRAGARHIDLILAGDIFDIHRTQLWFNKSWRPYVPLESIATGSEGERAILEILEGIAKEPDVAESLAVLQALGRKSESESARSGDQRVPITVHFLPGNHDRLLNATPAIRQRTRVLLGMSPGPEPFPHTFVPENNDPRVLVRHGHEYDAYNFGKDYSRAKTIPTRIAEGEYGAPTFGDYITIDVASRLPYELRQEYGDAALLGDTTLGNLYLRLLEFDDVRPQSMLLQFLLDVSSEVPKADVWSRVWPAARRVLDVGRKNPFFMAALRRRFPLFFLALRCRIWAFGFPLWLAQAFSWLARHRGSQEAGPERFASREQAIAKGAARFIVAGHTHNPQVAVLPANKTTPGDRCFVDTGTWRNRFLPDSDGKHFGDLKALTYVTVYASSEDPGMNSTQTKDESFDYWSGFTQRWHIAEVSRFRDREPEETPAEARLGGKRMP